MGNFKGAIVGMLVLALVGCSGVSRVPMVMDDGIGKAIVMTTISDPHAFVPSTQRNWLEVCSYEHKTYDFLEADSHAQWVYGDWKFYDCHRDGDVQFTTSSGYIAGLASPLLYSAAAAYGMHEIGKGLGKSGSTTNNSLGGGNATANGGSNSISTSSSSSITNGHGGGH